MLVHSKSGYLDNAIKRLHTSKKGKQAEQPCIDHDAVDEAALAINNINLNELENPIQKEHPSGLVRALKSTVVNEQNIDLIKAKLRETMDYRCKMLKNEKLDYRIEFPYFFTNPDLVCITIHSVVIVHTTFHFHLTPIYQIDFDFGIRHSEVDGAALGIFWGKHGNKLHKILIDSYPKLSFKSGWSQEVDNVLTLLRLFPAKNKPTAELFNKAMEKLLVFRMVC